MGNSEMTYFYPYKDSFGDPLATLMDPQHFDHSTAKLHQQ